MLMMGSYLIQTQVACERRYEFVPVRYDDLGYSSVTYEDHHQGFQLVGSMQRFPSH